MRRRGFVALAVLAVAAWALVGLTGHHGKGAVDRPARLINPTGERVIRLTVADPETGREVTLAGAQLRSRETARLVADLSPLLAVRVLPTVEPEYDLAPPRADLVVETASGRLPAIHLGGTNFDRTGYYVTVEGRRGAALVLMRVGDAVLHAAG